MCCCFFYPCKRRLFCLGQFGKIACVDRKMKLLVGDFSMPFSFLKEIVVEVKEKK